MKAVEGPRIVAFCCHYCAYAAADLAGTLRVQYAPNVRIVRLPCTGKVEIINLLRAFEEGADGVYVAGCLEGNCHYIEGNIHARKRVERARELLAQVGIEPERLEMFNMSAAMGNRFAEVADEMTTRIRGMKPLWEEKNDKGRSETTG